MVAGGAAVSLDVVVEAVEVNCIRSERGRGESAVTCRISGFSEVFFLLLCNLRYRRGSSLFLVATHLKTPNFLITGPQRRRERSIRPYMRSSVSVAPHNRRQEKKHRGQIINDKAGNIGYRGAEQIGKIFLILIQRVRESSGRDH